MERKREQDEMTQESMHYGMILLVEEMHTVPK